jgi:cellulose synthase/poly-beta-1,6-N-acetylglucosamine synthase-like glycosyltransferase
MTAGDLADSAILLLCLIVLPYFGFMLLTSLAALVRGNGPADPLVSGAVAVPARRRFLVAIPAHDEEAIVATTVASCLTLEYPPGLFEVLVIADNCTDETAARAREAGARIFERRDATRRGKGYAIESLIRWLRETGEFDLLDAIVVVDADTTVHPDLLRTFARSLDAGHDWVQCYDTVGNAERSWRTRLMAHAFSLINGVTLQGQMALGLSAALRGNGMCLSTRGLDRVPWDTSGLTEDLEYSWSVRIAGGRIAFAREAAVYATMLTRGGRASVAQRRRWESGRRELRSKLLRPLLRSPHLRPLEKVASLVELTMPTTVSLCLAYLVLSLAAAARLPDIVGRWGLASHALMALCWLIATLALAVQFVSPFLLSFLPWRYGLSMVFFPYYACWKALVALRSPPKAWTRTMRES